MCGGCGVWVRCGGDVRGGVDVRCEDVRCGGDVMWGDVGCGCDVVGV